VDNLNAALSAVLAADPDLYLLGEDILDPYGGAFKVTRGLSTRFPRQVLGTPISEGAIVGVANGLALAGGRAIVEIMFGDFAALAFDQIVNVTAKSVSMYGRPVPMPLVVRCPSGGNRGYGPTHSQSLQKHFLGVPDLAVYELTPFHELADLFAGLLAAGTPSVVFEDKVLYTAWMAQAGTVDDVFRCELLGPWPGTARVHVEQGGPADCVIIAPGGLAHRAITAMHELLIRDEVLCELYVPARLYPLDLAPVLAAVAAAGVALVLDDGPPGAGWAVEVSHGLTGALWGALRRPVRTLPAADRVVPTAAHLEQQVLVQPDLIRRAVLEERG
jgi:pyruvate dehydrogenase E1 component beta subunit